MVLMKKWKCIEPGDGASQGLCTDMIVLSVEEPNIPGSEWEEQPGLFKVEV